MKIVLDKKFADRVNGRFSKYSFEVGILENKNYRRPRPKSDGLTTIARGPARKAGRKPSKLTVADVSRFNRENGKVDYLREPFRKPGSQDAKLIKRFLFEFIKMTAGSFNPRRLENLLQAMVRNPIARGDYGRNKSSTAQRKGFNRLMIDTAQMFRAIKARVIKGRSR